MFGKATKDQLLSDALSRISDKTPSNKQLWHNKEKVKVKLRLLVPKSGIPEVGKR